MAVRFTLNKPRYGWRPLEEGGNALVLADEVKQWLEDRAAIYRTWTQDIKNYQDDRTYRYFFIWLEDDNVAMQFKLTWI